MQRLCARSIICLLFLSVISFSSVAVFPSAFLFSLSLSKILAAVDVTLQVHCKEATTVKSLWTELAQDTHAETLAHRNIPALQSGGGLRRIGQQKKKWIDSETKSTGFLFSLRLSSRSRL